MEQFTLDVSFEDFDFVLFEEDFEYGNVSFPVSFDALFAVLFDGLLPGMDFDEGRELSEDVEEFVFLFLESVSEFVFVESEHFEFLFMVFLQLLDQTVVMVDCPLELSLDRLVVLQLRVS